MIIPAILEKDFEEVKRKVELVRDIAGLIQIDIADGLQVNGKTCLELKKIETLDTHKAQIELHLMVKNPLQFLPNKTPHITKICTQIENIDCVDEFISRAKKQGYKVGLSLNSDTPIGKLNPYITKIDFVQFMTVEPGTQGSKYLDETNKIKAFKKLYPQMPTQVDGGVTENNIHDIVRLGIDHVVVGSAIFNSKNVQEKFEELSKKMSATARDNTLTSLQTLPLGNRVVRKVAFLGGAAWKPQDPAYKDAYTTAKLLAQNGYEIVNGGGPGVMRAATLGAHEGGGKALAVTYHPNKPKRHYEGVDPENTFDEEVLTLDYFDRTKVMLQNTDIHIVFNGSIGTLSEFGMTWVSSWIHDPNYKPIILYGGFWQEFIAVIRKNMVLTKSEDNLLKICNSPEEVLDYIKSLEG